MQNSNACLLFLFLLAPTSCLAGMFADFGINQDGSRAYDLAVMTEDTLYVGGFFGQKQYLETDATRLHTYMAGGVGYRWYGEWITSVLLGFENSVTVQTGQNAGPQNRFRGLYSQLVLLKFFNDMRFEYILAYSVNSEELWTRSRLFKTIQPEFSIGPEIVISRFLGRNVNSASIVLEKVFYRFTTAGKIGFENNGAETKANIGVELYKSF